MANMSRPPIMWQPGSKHEQTIIHAKRHTDAVVAIRQNDIKKLLEITRLNIAAEKLTGYSITELKEQNLKMILPDRIIELIENYIDFGGESDFAYVAGKIPNFQVLAKDKSIISVSLKVYNLVKKEGGFQEYELLMRDITLLRKIEELKKVIHSHHDDPKFRDPDTGLVNMDGITDSLQISYEFIEQYHTIDICFVLMEMFNIREYAERYGEHIALKILGALGAIITKCCREEDVIGYMGYGIIGAIFVNCGAEDADFVINRIKNTLRNATIKTKDGENVEIKLGAAYLRLREDIEISDAIGKCETGLDHLVKRGDENGTIHC